MYLCPLCASEVGRKAFASLESLRVHLDLYHCTISGPVHRSVSTIHELEWRIEKLVDSHTSNETRNPFEDSRMGLVQRYASECDLARAENEYLKRKLKDEKRKCNEHLDEQRQQYENIEWKYDRLVQFIESTSRKQIHGKKKLEEFVERLIGDLENVEMQLQRECSDNVQLSRSRREPCDTDEQDSLVASTRHRKYGLSTPTLSNTRFVERESTDRQNGLGSSMSVSGRKSNMSRSLRSTALADSGYDDVLELEKTPAYRTHNRVILRANSIASSPFYALDRTSLLEDELDGELVQPISADFDHDSYTLALALVFQRLDAFDLTKCSLVCRKWCTIARNPLIWRTTRIRNRKVTNEFLEAISPNCSRTVKLTLQNLRPRETTRIRRTVESKEHNTGVLEDGLEAILQSCDGHLLFLKIVDCSPALTDRVLWLAACYCKNLEKVIYVSDQFPATAPSLWALGASCRTLNTLIVPPAQNYVLKTGGRAQFDDEALLMIARCFPTTLRVLCVGGRGMTINGIKYIAHSCQWLDALELDHCFGLTLRAARYLCTAGLKSLQALHFIHCDVSPVALEYFHDHLPQLQSIRVVFSWTDFPTSKHLESFLAECQSRLNKNLGLKKILRIEERTNM